MSNCKTKCASCKGCPSLKAVEPLPPEPVSRNFWNSCPRNLEALPTEECHLGKPEKNKKGKIVKEPDCEWWIDSAEHNYCFWNYVQANSAPDGRMDPMMQNDIAKMLGCSSTKIHFILKEALEKIRNGPYAYILEEFAQEIGNKADDHSFILDGIEKYEPDPEPEE